MLYHLRMKWCIYKGELIFFFTWLDTQSYVLNFHGRVTQASVKNFQIVMDADGKWRIQSTCSLYFPNRPNKQTLNSYPLCTCTMLNLIKRLCLMRVTLTTVTVLQLTIPRSNLMEFRSVGFWGGRKTGVPREKPLEQGCEPTTNSTHIWCWVQDSNPGHIGGRQALTTAPSLHVVCSSLTSYPFVVKFECTCSL